MKVQIAQADIAIKRSFHPIDKMRKKFHRKSKETITIKKDHYDEIITLSARLSALVESMQIDTRQQRLF